jgi:hypothetical protein
VAVRTTRFDVTFDNSFTLKGSAGIQPPGTYEVETEEEIIEGNEHVVYRRVSTILYIRSPGMTRSVTISADDLELALARDRLR